MRRSSLVVSGINHGANLGDDVSYSGTVAAAIEGQMMGCASVAISLDDWRPGGFAAAGSVARRVVENLIERGFLRDPHQCQRSSLLRERTISGYRITRLGKRTYSRPDRSQDRPAGTTVLLDRRRQADLGIASRNRP